MDGKSCMNCIYEYTCNWKPAGEDNHCEEWRADGEVNHEK